MMIIKSESLAKLAPALLKAQKNMGAALKDSKNPFYKSKYADLNAIIDASIPALNNEGISVLQAPAVKLTGTTESVSVIQTILLHESGEYLAGESEVVAAKQNDPQAAGSATTYARRYGLQAMVTLKAEDDDGERAMGRGGATRVETGVSASKNSSEGSPTMGETKKPNTSGGFKKASQIASESKPETELY